MTNNKQRSDYANSKFVDIETAAFLCGLSTKEFNKLYNEDGFFKRCLTSDNLIIKSTIDDWQNGKLARPMESKSHLDYLEDANRKEVEKQRQADERRNLDNNIINAYKAKRHLQSLNRNHR